MYLYNLYQLKLMNFAIAPIKKLFFSKWIKKKFGRWGLYDVTFISFEAGKWTLGVGPRSKYLKSIK